MSKGELIMIVGILLSMAGIVFASIWITKRLILEEETTEEEE